tara:strand:- start:4795 stop:6129 length:1335 start_codon:yes stop_codon:yes gene_type:complete
MDVSKQATDEFIFINICQKDKTLKKLLDAGNVSEFRKRIPNFPNADAKIEKAVLSIFTDQLKVALLTEVSKLTKLMAPLGFLIIGGGFAINKYLPEEQRDVVTDLDTKFVPSVMGMKPDSPRYFGYLQLAKILMWHYLGLMAKRMSSKPFMTRVMKKAMKNIKMTNAGKCLGITLKSPIFKRRYTLIPKFKHGGTAKVVPHNVLIDVEVMALDLGGVRFFIPSKREIATKNLGGILDIAYMRKGEVGGKVLSNTTAGFGNFKNVLVAGKQFLLDDIYMLKVLKLRPAKLNKNRERFLKFSKYVFDVSNKNLKNSNFKVYESASRQKKGGIKFLKQRTKLTNAGIQKIARLNPKNNEKYTTPLSRAQIFRYSYRPFVHNQEYRFNNKTMQWVKNNRNSYIHEKWNGRNANPILYGFNPTRDSWLPSVIIEKAKLIPFVGFKDKKV